MRYIHHIIAVALLSTTATVAAQQATQRSAVASKPQGTGQQAPAMQPAPPLYANKAELRSAAQTIVDTFAAQVAKARGKPLAVAPSVAVHNTPQLIYFDGKRNLVVIPWWDAEPAGMRAVFRRFAGGDDAAAEALFRVFFNRFLVAHETAHWFQWRAHRGGSTRYMQEDMANRLAVAFWRTQPGGERFLAGLERLAKRAAASVPDPTPKGQDPVAFFQANYAALSANPLKYGYYQWKFMADALHDRSQLDFARMTSHDASAAREDR